MSVANHTPTCPRNITSFSKEALSMPRHSVRQVIVFMAIVALMVASPVLAAKKITVMLHYSPGFPHGQSLSRYVDEYEALGLGLELEYNFVVVDGFMDKLAVMSAAGSAPDAVHIAGYMLGELAENRIIEPVPTDIAGIIRKSFLPGAIDLVRYGGKLWGYPTEYMPRAMAYNNTLFAQAGLADESPATWDDLGAYGRKLTKADADGVITQTGFAITAATGSQVSWGQLFSFAYPLGGRFLSEDGRRVAFNSEPVRKTLDFFQDLVTAGAGAVRSWPIVLMKEQRAAMTLASGPYWRTELMATSQDIYNQMRSGPIPVPQAGMTPAHSAYGWLWALTTNSPSKKETYDFLTWLNTRPDDGQTRMGRVLAHLGSIPVTPTDLRGQQILQEPFMQGFVEVVANNRTFPEPVLPKGLDMMSILELETRYALAGRESSVNALTKAEQAIQAILSQVYR
jgi:multiple sugar transport system substrate-binding protein